MSKELHKRIISSLIIIPIALFFIIKGSFFFIFFLSIFFLGSSYEWIKMNRNNFIKFFGVTYLFLSFFLAYLVRDKYGLNIFLLIVIICIFTDLGGFIFGKIFKGPKLTKISPNKTYSGVIGSFVISVTAACIYIEYEIIREVSFLELVLTKADGSPTLYFLIISLVISTVSQFGDLVVSYFKRLAKIKDTGKTIPGHGGILDRLDGIIFAVPVSFLIFNLIY